MLQYSHILLRGGKRSTLALLLLDTVIYFLR